MSLTLDQITSHVTQKIGQFDSVSLARCKEYAQQRYQLIYDAHLWKDSLALVAGTTVGVTGVFDVPAGIDLIVAIRSNGDTMLEAVDEPFLMQMNPDIFEQTGTPLAFVEYVDTLDSNQHKVRVYPLPTSTLQLLIVGKRTLVPLVLGTDMPVLSNIDNCLLAATMADMLERARQYSKAQVKAKEAESLLNLMLKIENEQAANIQRVVPEVHLQYETEYSLNGIWSK